MSSRRDGRWLGIQIALSVVLGFPLLLLAEVLAWQFLAKRLWETPGMFTWELLSIFLNINGLDDFWLMVVVWFGIDWLIFCGMAYGLGAVVRKGYKFFKS